MMALGSYPSSSFTMTPTTTVCNSDLASDQTSITSQKRKKEEINQSLIDSCSLEKQEFNHSTESHEFSHSTESHERKISMSSNLATKLSQLTLSSENDSWSANSETLTNVMNDSVSSSRSRKETGGTRATPKQVFPNIPCLPLENNIFYSFVLSVWDNIVGPQTVYVWKRKSKINLGEQSETRERDFSYTNGNIYKHKPKRTNSIPSDSSYPDEIPIKHKRMFRSNTLSGSAIGLIDHKKNGVHQLQRAKKRLCLANVVKYVTEHTVGVGESGRWKANKMVSFYLSVPHQDIVIQSVRFYIIEDGVGVPYCLSAVVHSQDESHLIPVFSIVTDIMYRISAKVRLLITKEGLDAGDRVRESLQELCSTISSLREASLSLYPLTTLSRTPDDRRLAERMLTSHLQTMGTSLVIADSPHEANRLVMWLGQFLSEEEMTSSRIALSDGLWPFQPGLCVQAVIRGGDGTIDLSSSRLISSPRPLTIIDLKSNTVRQMDPMNVHTKNSCANFRMELLALWHDLDHVPAPSQSLFEPVEVASPMVKRFLYEWDRLAACEPHVRRTFLEAFLRSLHYSALAIIAWHRHEKPKEKKRREAKSILQTISSTFMIDEPDLKVVLAQAEKLEPGFLSTLLKKQDLKPWNWV